jgi:hypothetical protein
MQKRGKSGHKPHTALDKAQAALEFLMTYGWVIMVVMVAIGSLSYFGVLSPDAFLPKRCSLPVGICLDYEIGSSRITLVLQNNFGETITISRIDVSKKNNGSCSNTNPVTLKNNVKAIVIISGCDNGDSGEKFDGEINVTYTKESLLSHKMSGALRAKIVEGATTTSFAYCQDMENGGLCEGLDVLFGEGYRAACCSEHGLCC